MIEGKMTRRTALAGLMSSAFMPSLPQSPNRGIAYIVYEGISLASFADRITIDDPWVRSASGEWVLR